MPKYLMIARDAGSWEQVAKGASPSEIQAILGKYKAWSDRVAQKGNLRSGEKLRDGDGRVVRSESKNLRVTNGPYSEGKEVIGGFWILEAGSYEEAAQLASDNPHLEHGSLELREIEEMN